jgi:hypothetical protein
MSHTLAAMVALAITGWAQSPPAKPVDAKPASSKLPTARQAAKDWKAPRTLTGQPDLQGVWTNATITPLERPANLGDKVFFTEQEARQFEVTAFEAINSERRDGGNEVDVGRSYNEFWRDRGRSVVASRRTSLITDPPTGRIPALTPEAQKRQADRRAYARQHPADGPEDLGLWVRCVTRGVPMVPGPYNNDFQITQTPGYAVILHEMIHETRVIPLDGRPHVPAGMRFMLGDARGRWEGETLVVDSANFSELSNFQGSNTGLHLVERFTRTAPDKILYQFTVEDPSTFTRPWSAEMPMTAMDNPIYEYACNEGNYAMSGLLGAARADEKKAQKK